MSNVPLQDYIDRRLEDLERRVTERFALQSALLQASEVALRERLHGMNEIREAMKDQSNRMATRHEMERLDQIVRELQKARANLDGRIVATGGLGGVMVACLLWALTRFFK